jgi:hypothetical protein
MGRRREPMTRHPLRLMIYPRSGEAVVTRAVYRGRILTTAGVEPSERPTRSRLSQSRRELRRFTTAWGVDHMWTLTYRNAPLAREDAVSDTVLFIRRLRVRIGFAIPWALAVEEHPRRGGFHVHLGVPGFLSWELVQSAWGRGGVSGPSATLQHRLANRGAIESSRALASYLLKDAERRPGLHRYKRARGFEVPVLALPVGSPDEGRAMAVDLFGAEPSWQAGWEDSTMFQAGFWVDAAPASKIEKLVAATPGGGS